MEGIWILDNLIKIMMTIPHLTLDPNITFPISIAVITILLAGYGVYRGFFANQNLTDPWDDHDD